jgi:hypothetical protein
VVREWHQGLYLITTDKASLDLEMIHGFLNTSCWTAGISVRAIKRSAENSLTFGLFADEEEADFARVVAATPPSTTSQTCSSWSLTAGGAWAIG